MKFWPFACRSRKQPHWTVEGQAHCVRTTLVKKFKTLENCINLSNPEGRTNPSCSHNNKKMHENFKSATPA